MPSNCSTEQHQQVLLKLYEFIRAEQEASRHQLNEVWERPLATKLFAGHTQKFTQLKAGPEPKTIWAYPDESESRFREGDLLCIHSGNPWDDLLGHCLSFEYEEETRWLLRGQDADTVLRLYDANTICYADPDAMDLTGLYQKALDEIAQSPKAQEKLLPLLAGNIEPAFSDADFAYAMQRGRDEGLNPAQCEGLALAFAAEHIACIQGPPGTGKTKVLSLLVKLMTERGARILMTSHTHMAINNALNKIAEQAVPVAKIARKTQKKGLNSLIPIFDSFDQWDEKPDEGYVIGATPFTTVTSRLHKIHFDVVIFDEASQITPALALMAMRVADTFIFIGDQKQLPPVVQSASVLSPAQSSIFSRLVSKRTDHSVMLNQCYRMNEWLTLWPSKQFYRSELESAGINKKRRFSTIKKPKKYNDILSGDSCAIFIPVCDSSARSRNKADADFIADLCESAIQAGLNSEEIGIVTPFRSQGRTIRDSLRAKIGFNNSRMIIADTVERMQGQEKELIILSLPCGDKSYLQAIAGFLFQPERLNVSITRAKTKLIIIGPELSDGLEHSDSAIQSWIDTYCDFVKSCKRMEIY